MSDDVDTTPETYRALASKFANMSADLLHEKRMTNAHLQTISNRIGFAPRSYPYLIAVVVILSGIHLIQAFR